MNLKPNKQQVPFKQVRLVLMLISLQRQRLILRVDLSFCRVMHRTVLPRPFCLSDCLSVKRMLCDKTKKTKATCAHILTPHKRSFILVVGRPILPKIVGQTDPVGAKTAIFNRY